MTASTTANPTPSDLSAYGFRTLTPLEMNDIHFDPRHTVLTPRVLSSLDPKSPGTIPKSE